ncbi:hypothetical protein BDV96DRAFT_648635 [Lophiotrema nucula]|uniref:Uncharacterized protein n=1 Tax=Lophiotrema nucula TaxID=690887 RepID=A0A6A5Z1T1_9PLEO|nr:hypothetical protein BDV96DRAFT_648635 [Lophiotrema nucula]
MAYALKVLHNTSAKGSAQDAVHKNSVVDIVIVHDLNRNVQDGWTESSSGVLWPRDLLPKSVRIARILAFEYEPSAARFFQDSCERALRTFAENLMTFLHTDRDLEGCERRSIIFLFDFLYSIFVSTYAIIFFGTYHTRHDATRWLDYEHQLKSQRIGLNRLKSAVVPKRDSDAILSINVGFSPLMKQFHVFFFWEQIVTDIGNRAEHMVDYESAAPVLEDTERASIYATHYDMVKHTRPDDTGYRTILSALLRYTRAAPALIHRRWEKASEYLRGLRSQQASELAGFDFNIHVEEPSRRASEVTEKILNEYFFLPREAYWGVFTIDATSTQTAQVSFAELGRLGGLEATGSAGRHWLSTRKQPWLPIIDNADDPTLDVARMIPVGINGQILITTRNPYLHSLGTIPSIELKGMKKHEALQLLFKRAEIPMPWEKSKGYIIAEALGYLALALIQAGNCISRNWCELENCLKFHEEHRKKNNQRHVNSPGTSIKEDEVNVYPTFDFSLSALEMQDTVPAQDAVEILNIVAFYHFDNIRKDIFTRAVANTVKVLRQPSAESFKDRVAARIGNALQPPSILPRLLKADHQQLHEFRITKALYELYKLSFITYSVKGDAISLHPLVHSWARDRLELGQRRLWAQIALNTLLISFSLPPEDVDDGEGSFKGDMLPHLDSCLQVCPIKIGYSISPPTNSQLNWSKLFGWSLFFIMRQQVLAAAKCGYVYAARGRFSNAADHLTIAKDSLVQLLGDENEKTMASMLGLAHVCWGLGRLEEAIALQKRVVRARSKVYGAQHPDTLRAMDKFGQSHWLHGQYHEALSIQQSTTKQMALALGPEHDDTLAALDNLGVTLGSWYRYEESREVHERVLEARRTRMGPTHLDTLVTLNNLAMALLDLRKLEKAKEMMTLVYEERRKQLGKEHPWTLWAICNLSKVKIALNEYSEAEPELVEGIAAAKRSLGDDHLGVLMGEGQLARAYARQGRLEEGEQLGLQTLRRLEISRGVAHPDSVFARWKLVQLYELAGKHRDAISMCQVALERIKMRLSVSHPMFNMVSSKLIFLRRLVAGEPEKTVDGLEETETSITSFLSHRSQGQKTW